MERIRKYLFVGLCAVIIASSETGISGESITITGTINEDYQFVSDDGEVYIVAEPERVEQLDEIIDEKVKVTGSVEESEDVKIITITSYEVVGNETVAIVGTINSNYQIVTVDGEVYEIEASEKGEELIELVGRKVKATGMVGEYEGMKIIYVISYEII